MNSQGKSSPYPRISVNYHQSQAYENSTVVIPKHSQLLPSIYEINTDFDFPSNFTLDNFIYGDNKRDFISTSIGQDQKYQNDQSEPRSSGNENYNRKIMPNQENIEIHANLPNPQINQNNYQNAYNRNEYSNNKPIDTNYIVQYQIPYNSFLAETVDKSYETYSPNLNYISIQSRLEDNSRMLLDPAELGFIPAEQWTKGKVSLENLKNDFFCARSSKCLRFEYKLWNALQITRRYPFLFSEIGVRWIAKSFIMVHRDIFGHLLQVTRPSAALFSSCGMFMTHGFREILLSEIRTAIDPREIGAIDESIVRLFAHKENDFNEDSGPDDIIKIKWNNESRKKVEKL